MPFLPHYISYNIWSQFQPAVGRERFHCDMKRGFDRARSKEPHIAKLRDFESEPMRIGHWVQKGVYNLVKQPKFMARDRYFLAFLRHLQLRRDSSHPQRLPDESELVKQRVVGALLKYRKNPFLNHLNVLQISTGEEGIPEAIRMRRGRFEFNLFAAFDCLVEIDDKLCVLDLKTGKLPFDRRQAYVYLLALRQLYPERPLAAFFHNVETQTTSDLIEATPGELRALEWELIDLAKRHQQQLRAFRKNPDRFAQIYPPNPGVACRYCQFKSACEFASKSAGGEQS